MRISNHSDQWATVSGWRKKLGKTFEKTLKILEETVEGAFEKDTGRGIGRDTGEDIRGRASKSKGSDIRPESR